MQKNMKIIRFCLPNRKIFTNFAADLSKNGETSSHFSN